MSKSFDTQVRALESTASASGQALSEAIQQLVYQVQPRTQANILAQDVKYRAEKLNYEAMNTIDDARDGDPDARKKLMTAAAVAVGVLALCMLRRKLKRRGHR